MVYSNHDEVLQVFRARGLVPRNGFFGVHQSELYHLLAATDVG